MRTAAVIAEFNPLHHGHRLLLEQCRVQAGADCVVVVLSGNFVQRGSPACLEVQKRAAMALGCEADVVLSLPLPYAMATAERFAFGAVSTLHRLGGVEQLVFGSECGSLEVLWQQAEQLEKAENSSVFREMLAQGMGFAQARQSALEELGAGELLRSPNNALGVEYLRQLRRLNASITPFTILREGAGHDSSQSLGKYASATLIRQWLEQGALPLAEPFLPEESYRILRQAWEAGGIASLALGERAVLARLRGLAPAALSTLPDCSEGIENRLWKAIREACTLEQLCDMIKTRRYSMARVRRLVFSAFLQVDGSLCRQSPPYAHLLGFTPMGARQLSRWKETSSIPVSASLRQLEALGGMAERFASLEARAGDLYSVFLPRIRPCGYEYTAPVIVAGKPIPQDHVLGK